MSSGVRILDGLGHQPRSKTVLNGNREILMVSQGWPLELQAVEGQEPQAPTRVELVPINITVRVYEWDWDREKIQKLRVEITREYVEQMVANTIDLRNGNPLPWYTEHLRRGPAYGWFRAEDLEITDRALVANNVEWIGKTAAMITGREFRYCSIGWRSNYRDYRTDKTIGPVLIESSLTNDPYIVGQRGLAASGENMLIAAAVPVDAAANLEEAEMLEKLRGLLGLSAEATEEEAGAAVEAAVKAGAELAEIDKALEGVEGADRAAKLATLATAKPADDGAGDEAEPGKGADAPDKGAAGMGADAAEVLVEAAVAAGRVPPKGEGREKLAKALAALSVADAKEVLSLVSAGVPKGGDLKSKVDGGGDGDVPAMRAEIAKQTGLTAEDFAKYGPKRD